MTQLQRLTGIYFFGKVGQQFPTSTEAHRGPSAASKISNQT